MRNQYRYEGLICLLLSCTWRYSWICSSCKTVQVSGVKIKLLSSFCFNFLLTFEFVEFVFVKEDTCVCH